MPQQLRILDEKTRGLRRIVSPRKKLKRGQPKWLSPNRSLSPNGGRRGTNINGRERQEKQGKAANVGAKQETPCAHQVRVKVCVPVNLSFISSYNAKKRRQKREKKKKERTNFQHRGETPQRIPYHPNYIVGKEPEHPKADKGQKL